MVIDKDFEIDCLKKQLINSMEKNAKFAYFIRKLSEKIEFYKDLSINSEYDKGFNKAFELVQNYLINMDNHINKKG